MPIRLPAPTQVVDQRLAIYVTRSERTQIEAYAKARRISVSAAGRILLQKGLRAP